MKLTYSDERQRITLRQAGDYLKEDSRVNLEEMAGLFFDMLQKVRMPRLSQVLAYMVSWDEEEFFEGSGETGEAGNRLLSAAVDYLEAWDRQDKQLDAAIRAQQQKPG